jgi:DNA polymerase-3 subunit beta
MKLKIDRKEIVDALVWVSRVLVTKIAVAAVSSIQIIAEDGKVTFKATNIDSFAISLRDAEVTESGEAIVSGRALLEIIKLLPDEKIELKTENNKLEISTSKTNHILPIVVTQLQETSFDNFEKIADVNTEEFIQLLSQTGIAVAKEDSIPILTTANLMIKKNVLEVRTIDRYRVAKKTMDILNFSDKDFQIPVKHKDLASIISGVERTKQIELYYHEKNKRFGVVSENDQISFSLITGDFPNTDNLFRSDYKSVIMLERKALLNAVNRASVLTEATLGITLTFEKNKLTISSQSDNVSSREEIDCEYDGDNLKLKFNSTYTKEGLNQIEEDYVLCKIDEPIKPVEFVGYTKDTAKDAKNKGSENEDYKYVIVPIRET